MKAREISNVKTVQEMKKAIAQKLKDEGSCFKTNDVHIDGIENGFWVYVTDYEHSAFKVVFEYDDYFGYIVYVYNGGLHTGELECIGFYDSKIMLDLRSACICIGYAIGTRF